MKVIRDIAESAGLEEGKNLVLNKYVTEVHYNETGDTPVKVVSKDTRTGKMTIFRAKWVILTFRSEIIFISKYHASKCFLVSTFLIFGKKSRRTSLSKGMKIKS